MTDSKTRILLIEDDPDDALLFGQMIQEMKAEFELTVVQTLEKGIARLAEGGVQLVLLDLALPDSRGLETFLKIRSEAPSVPVVVLTGLDDDALALEAAQRGAQDYLVKGSVSPAELKRSIRYAVERSRVETELRNLALIDDRTGLYNRRGFLTMGEQYLKLTLRTRQGLCLVYAEIAGFKQIGSKERELALIRGSKIFRNTFRQSDLAAHFGDGLFAALTMETGEDKSPVITARLNARLDYEGARSAHGRLAVKISEMYYNPEDSYKTIDDLLVEAQKRHFSS
jgi:two-component system, cell cycle response regulator